MAKGKSVVVNVSDDFYKMIEDFIKLFQKTNGIELSFSQATKILKIKIDNLGGLQV